MDPFQQLNIAMGRLTARGGQLYINNYVAHENLAITKIVVQDDTVIQTLKGGVAADSSTDYLNEMNLGSVTLKRGTILWAPEGACFRSIQIDSTTPTGALLCDKE